jgi:hypothetical protein
VSRDLATVVRRREALVARAAAQRAELAALVERHRLLLGIADVGFRAGRVLARYPLWAMIGAALLFKTQRHRLLFWSGQLITLWELYRAFRGPRRAGHPGR